MQDTRNRSILFERLFAAGIGLAFTITFGIVVASVLHHAFGALR